MYKAIHNLIKENGALVHAGTENLKAEDIGSKEVIQRFLDLGSIEEQEPAKSSAKVKASKAPTEEQETEKTDK